MRLPSKLVAASAICAAAAALTAGPAAAAGSAPAITVSVHPAVGAGSYFTIVAAPGSLVRAGTLEIRNRRHKSVPVRLDPVGAVTATTLGSAYRVATDAPTAQARWIVLPRRLIVLGPGARAIVPVLVRTPTGIPGGDYLSGISVQALGHAGEARTRGNIAIASVQRYAIGLFEKIPGPRHPSIRIPSASVTREPAGLTFFVNADNRGNEILQGVHGRILVTRGRRTVAKAVVGPGTFVSGTSIAYPLMAPREQPREGAVYRVRAVMHYGPRVARLDTLVRFGHRAAQEQQAFGGPPADQGQGAGSATFARAAIAALAVVLLIVALVLLRRRRTPGERAARRALEQAVAEARLARKPLALVRIADSSGETSARKLAAAVRGHVRRGDRLYRFGPAELLLIAPNTLPDAARLVCSDFQLPLFKAAGPGRIDIRVVDAGRRTATDLIARLEQPAPKPLDEIELVADHARSDTRDHIRG
jgi:hypothetical protein